MKLDLTTLFYISALLDFFMAFYLLVVWYIHRNNYKGIMYFVIGMFLLALGNSAIAFRAVLTIFVSVVVGNVLILAGITFIYQSFAALFNHKISAVTKTILISAVIIGLINQIIFGVFSNNVTIRIIVVSTLYSIPAILILSLLRKKHSKNIVPVLFLIITFLLQTIVMLMRVPMTIIGPEATDFLKMGGFQTFSLTINTLTTCSWPIGYSLLIVEQLRLKAIEEHNTTKTLMHELNHRTKNTMQVMISLLSLQKKYSDSDIIKEELSAAESRLQSIAIVHENLYLSGDLSTIPLKVFVNDLTKLISENFNLRDKNIKIDMDVEELFVLIDTAIPIGLILNELLTNIFRHAFPDDSGIVNLKISRENNETIRITLKDDGIGIPANIALDKPKTLGLATVVNIVKTQLAGTLEIIANNGTICTIVVKNNVYKARI